MLNIRCVEIDKNKLFIIFRGFRINILYVVMVVKMMEFFVIVVVVKLINM